LPSASRTTRRGALDFNGKLLVLAGVDGQPMAQDVWAAA